MREAVLRLTRGTMARALGVTAQSIYYWENGPYDPSPCYEVLLSRIAVHPRRILLRPAGYGGRERRLALRSSRRERRRGLPREGG
ncbi:MAG: hypothetical protein HYY17_13575 [Planctomycetes bacterium]|nr:hypothetical protein [Planctomycetota bacterium]